VRADEPAEETGFVTQSSEMADAEESASSSSSDDFKIAKERLQDSLSGNSAAAGNDDNASPAEADDTPPETSDSTDSDDGAPPADEPEEKAPWPDAAAAPVLPPVLPAKSDVEQESEDRLSSALASDNQSSKPASEPHPLPSKTPSLELDWARLTAEGFSDPREGDRLLSSNMKEIVRALIRQAMSDQSSWRDRIILVTTPRERAAKTTASINFAFGLATADDHQVILADVDANARGAVNYLTENGGTGSVGISEALADETIDIADLLIDTDLARLTLVASGQSDDKTFDRLASRRMLKILRFMTKNPKALLVIDAPPILESQEAAVLSVVAGQVVLAVEAGRTTGDSIEHALQRLGDRHNVSLVLIESSGFGRGFDAPTTPSTRNDDGGSLGTGASFAARRRPAKVAALVAGAMLAGLLAFKTLGEAGSAMARPIDPMSDRSERWSFQPEQIANHVRWMGR
jgi:Mrp family chromosome partitioning ATPase